MRYLTICMLALLISACGGGGGSGTASKSPSETTPITAAAPATAQAGVYVGFYQEDALNNPEDPTAGAFVLKLPEANQSFAGNMFFTYVGCQTENVGKVIGTRSDSHLSGTWSGILDGEPNSGTFAANYQQSSGGFVGTFDNALGKHHRDLSPCIEYDIAAYGSLEAWKPTPSSPAFPAISSSPSTSAT